MQAYIKLSYMTKAIYSINLKASGIIQYYIWILVTELVVSYFWQRHYLGLVQTSGFVGLVQVDMGTCM